MKNIRLPDSFPAALRTAHRLGAHACLAVLGVAAALGFTASARAERADRDKPLNVEADSGRYDDLKQIGLFSGNVVLTKGTLALRAAQVEVRQTPDGYHHGVASAAAGQLASFRQKRDGVDETIQGEAERIEYDGKADTLRLVNRAVIRRYRGATLADETSGGLIVYDSAAETFSVTGGASAATPANPGGRVRATLGPRAASPEAAASQPQPQLPLKPSGSLGGKP
jgi:lipopolysaccharide export system protein LptA